MNRIEALKQKAFEEKGFDGFLIANEINALYFSHCPGLACLLIPKIGENKAYVYNVNYEQAKAEAKGFKVELVKRNENLMAKIAEQAKAFKIKKLAIDALNVENYRKLAKELRGKTKLSVKGSLIWELRKVKDEEELEFMRKAGKITNEGMKTAYEVIRSGIKEIEAAAEIEYAMRKRGSWGTSFETILASGIRSAYPHGGCTDKEIRDGDLVVVDVGAAYKYYRSDMTRTLVAGKPSQKQIKLYEVVKEAQEKAVRAVKPKAKAKEIDNVARTVIEKAGYGEYFVHGLGHGVGLEVHEPPTLNPESKDKLAIGNVVTIEPGTYIIGFGGVRIEDTVLVKKGGAEKFTEGFYTLERAK
ncbi:MAG: Xaa-Pro peptidase family protein [Candidatus Bathyarchaeota archaeon]|nr:Xaa-Pro peptidase family protein [Candidatus Bathyarchaeota archaeon]